MPDLWTLDEWAARVRLAPRTLRYHLSQGRGPKVTRLGGRVFVRDDDGLAWLEENRGDWEPVKRPVHGAGEGAPETERKEGAGDVA